MGANFHNKDRFCLAKDECLPSIAGKHLQFFLHMLHEKKQEAYYLYKEVSQPFVSSTALFGAVSFRIDTAIGPVNLHLPEDNDSWLCFAEPDR